MQVKVIHEFDPSTIDRVVAAIMAAKLLQEPFLTEAFVHSESKPESKTEYRVTKVGNTPVACTCPGFHFRGRCKHLDMAR